jgi:twitching motility protein PilT
MQPNLEPNPIASAVVTGTSNIPERRITLSQLVNLCIEKEASDIHFREGGKLALRVGGKIVFIENIDKLSRDEAKGMMEELIPDPEERRRFNTLREIDFSYAHANGVNFRVNLFTQKGKLAGVMRMISKHVPTLEELGVPETVKKFLNLREGLIVVSGPAGSGKSTTIQSMLRYINENFVKHVLTIENPIEYVFEDNKSMFTQRELGKDTLTMSSALHSALREDANIVVVSEIINQEALDSILKLVETGHLVIASMLTRDATQTLERMVSFYPPDLQKLAKDRLASSLEAVVSQDLVQRIDQPGLIAVFEVMSMTPSIHNIIRRGNFVQLRTAIQAANEVGMITLDNYAYHLAERGIISQADLNEYIQREE